MDQQDNHDQAAAAKSRKDRGKLIFLGVIAVAMVLVYISQRGGALPDWPEDLPAALAQARREDRKVLVFFVGDPISTNAADMSKTTLSKNRPHIEQRKLIKVLIQIQKTDDLAKRYKIEDFPTFLLLDAQGKELNRRVGFVGEVAFRNDFLDCATVKKP